MSGRATPSPRHALGPRGWPAGARLHSVRPRATVPRAVCVRVVRAVWVCAERAQAMRKTPPVHRGHRSVISVIPSVSTPCRACVQRNTCVCVPCVPTHVHAGASPPAAGLRPPAAPASAKVLYLGATARNPRRSSVRASTCYK